jgi:hypothetical protein
MILTLNLGLVKKRVRALAKDTKFHLSRSYKVKAFANDPSVLSDSPKDHQLALSEIVSP